MASTWSPSASGRAALAAAVLGALCGCVPGGPVFPPRPPADPGPPVVDPPPSRVVVHLTMTRAGLEGALAGSLPEAGEGTFELLGSERGYAYRRGAASLSFSQGRVGIELPLDLTVSLPLTKVEVSLKVRVLAEPVVTSEYALALQSVDVQVSSDDRLLKVADRVGGALEKVRRELAERLRAFRYDARPLVEEAYGKLSSPVELPLGDARGCAQLRVLGVEAGPTVLADGIEKDLALIVAPSVTLPCEVTGPPPPLPPLANVAAVPSGPFTVTLVAAARYDELTKAMGRMFTEGRYAFSTQYPDAYLEKPEVYASGDGLVLRVHVGGVVKRYFLESELDGDVYFVGHPTVRDNELLVADLQPTIESSNLLVQLKAALDGDKIRDDARAALRLDVGARVAAARDEIAGALSAGGPAACFRGSVARVEVTGIHPHPSYLRLTVTATGTASAYVPCP